MHINFLFSSMASNRAPPGFYVSWLTSCPCTCMSLISFIGMQFENHGAHPEGVADRIIGESEWLGDQGKEKQDVVHLMDGARQHREEIEEKFAVMMKNFIGLLGR